MIFLVFAGTVAATELELDKDKVAGFISQMAGQHHFARSELEMLFKQVNRSPEVLAKIARPAESMDWHRYRPIFVTAERAEAGVRFWRQHEALLAQVEREFGVDPAVIAAIIGVETYYGRNTGEHRVIDALATLAFAYPKRAAFFRSELEQFLLLTREQKIDPLTPQGSYAGAMGWPQFISSSYRGFAVDFDKNGTADLWRAPGDIIASVANYFKRHGWLQGQPVAAPARVSGQHYVRLMNDRDLQPRMALQELAKAGVIPERPVTGNPAAKLLALKLKQGNEYWLGFKNFYVITRYNHSPLYAMAVFQLAEMIRKGHTQHVKESSNAFAKP
jgi:membrane-bound lytic murein transglycosylase B